MCQTHELSLWSALAALTLACAERTKYDLDAFLGPESNDKLDEHNSVAAMWAAAVDQHRRLLIASAIVIVLLSGGCSCVVYRNRNSALDRAAATPVSSGTQARGVTGSGSEGGFPWSPMLAWHYALMAAFLTVGTANVLLKDGLVQPLPPVYVHGIAYTNFHYPLLWNCITFLGMSICMPLYHLSRADANDAVEPSVPWRVLVLAVALHWTALFLVNAAYGTVEGSCLQVLRGSKLVFTSGLLSVVFGERQQAHQWMGVAVASLGMMIVSKSIVAQTDLRTTTGVMGQVLFSEFLRSILYVYQSKVMKRYQIPALYLTGALGLIGSLFSVFVIVVASGCNRWTLPLVVYNQLSQSSSLCLIVGAFMVVVGLFELTGIAIGRRSAVTRAMLELCRPGVCWAVELTFGWDTFTVIRAVGYVALTAGTLVYEGSFGGTNKSAPPKQ